MVALKWVHGIYTLYELSSQTTFTALMRLSSQIHRRQELYKANKQPKKSEQTTWEGSWKMPVCLHSPHLVWEIRERAEVGLTTRSFQSILLLGLQSWIASFWPSNTPWAAWNPQPKTPKAVVAEQGRKCPSPIPQHPLGHPASPATSPGWRHTSGNPATWAGRTNPEISPNIPVCPRTRNLRPVFLRALSPRVDMKSRLLFSQVLSTQSAELFWKSGPYLGE